MTRTLRRHACIMALCAVAALAALPVRARAGEESDLRTLEMFYEGKDLAVSATRSPKPISQTAENVTIVTAADIEMMGAHTLVDVLNNIPGFDVSDRGGPGSPSFEFSLQGTTNTHILILLDGVQLTFFGSSQINLSIIPVQNIERIEIIKGPGSSVWGSALGGVVNIVTKPPNDEKNISGAASFSGGERGTRDTRGELSGTVDRFGYYLYAGNLTSNGFRPGSAADQNNLFTKLRWDIPDRGALQYVLVYDRGTGGDGDSASLGYISKFQQRNILSSLGLAYRLTDTVNLDLSLRTRIVRDDDIAITTTGAPLPDLISREKSYGGSAKVTWRAGISTLVAGADFDHVNIDYNPISLYSDKYGVFLNDTLTFGPVAVTPGIRFDRMRPVGDFWSPSLGVAWSLDDKTILRTYAARGYGLPFLLTGSTQEKVNTVQVGMETSHVPCLWLKATLFLNYLSDLQFFPNEKHRKQGFELEGKTVPIFNTSLIAGFALIDTRDLHTGQSVQELGIPGQLAKLGLHYSDRNGFRASLLGRYVWFDRYAGINTRDKAVIWDLNLAKKFIIPDDRAIELFLNAHNLFNGAQYIWEGNQNARRWVEGGIRFGF